MHVHGSLTWIAAAQATRLLLQVTGTSLLARMLAPADFGLLAMASVVTTFATMLRDVGTSASIIRARQLDEEALSTAFWTNQALGVLIAAVVAACATLAECVLQGRGLQAVLVGVAGTFPLAALGLVHAALLERAGRFRALFAVELCASGLALGAALVAARRGYRAQSLVLQALTYAAINSGGLWTLARWRPAWRFDLQSARSLFHMGTHFTAFTFLNFFSRNADNLIVGRVLGTNALGTYAAAYKLMMLSYQTVATVLGRALVPSLTRAEGAAAAAGIYFQSVRLTCLLTAPATCLLFVLRFPLVALFFGEAWGPAADLLTWLAPAAFLQSIFSSSGSLLAARDQLGPLLKLAFLSMVLTVAAFLVSVRQGLEFLAFCYLLANVAQGSLCLRAATSSVGSSMLSLLQEIRSPALRGLATGAVASVLGHFYDLFRGPSAATLAATVVLSSLFWLALLLLWPGRDGALVRASLGDAARELPLA